MDRTIEHLSTQAIYSVREDMAVKMDERLHKLLSQWGIASRRQAEQLILAGRVRVNGQMAEVGQKADPRRDRIEVDGKVLQPENRPAPLYLLLNKPRGVVSTCQDTENRRTVLDLVPPEVRSHAGLHPVGRLDTDSTGAILLTNDGTLTFGLTHPSHGIPKVYRVWVEGNPPESVLDRWRKGVLLDGQKTQPAPVQRLKTTATATLLEIVLREGRNRQIRRVAEQLGYPVQRLHRMAFGPIKLGDLLPGQVRSLHPHEVAQLTKQMPAFPTSNGLADPKHTDPKHTDPKHTDPKHPDRRPRKQANAASPPRKPRQNEPKSVSKSANITSKSRAPQ